MQWCVWGLQLELTFLLCLPYVFFPGMVHMILLINDSKFWFWLLGFICLGFSFGNRWNIDNVFLVWYLFLPCAMHPLGLNGCIIRFPPWTFLLFCRSWVILFWHITLNYFQVVSNLLYYYGMCGVVKELLLKRYFSKVFSCFWFIQQLHVPIIGLVEWMDSK